TRDILVGGFAVPGSRVDILATINLARSGRQFVFPLLRNMLILAVDTDSQPPEIKVKQNVSDVSLAVTNDDATILVGAMSRGCAFRFVLLGDKPDSKYPRETDVDREKVRALLAGEYDPFVKEKETEDGTPVAPDTIALPVPTEDIPAGTKLTEEIINKAFTMQKIVPPAPANVIKDILAEKDKFTQKDIAANQFVPRSFLADSPPKKPDQVAAVTPEKTGKPGEAGDDASPKTAPELPPPPKAVKPPKFWTVTVQTGTGVRKYQYQILENGSYKFIGEIKVEEAPTEEVAKPDAETKPAAKPAAL
ncbi:MAG: RcpC/CpaB family pilus assembly protein, partial [Fimbriiglobus sp.]